MSRGETFTDVVLDQVVAQGDKPLYTFLCDDPGDAVQVRSYRDVDLGARAIAADLQERGLQGERVLLLYGFGPQFIEAFLGCLYAGAVAVPAPLPSGPRHQLERVGGIIRAADVALILSTSSVADEVRGMLAASGMSLPCLGTDGDILADPGGWSRPDITGESLAFLQYTSGSTSRPKGVIVSHANLLHNEALIMRKFGAGVDTRTGGWLPFHHDMGLIGQVLAPLASGGSATLMSPTAFLRRPHRWLEMISRHRLEISGGPNFSYEFCVQRVTDEQLAGLDLSGWAVAYNGAEPVRADTMAAFADRFAAAGFRVEAFYPCYGMAESTLMVSGGHPTGRPRIRLVSATQLERGLVLDASGTERRQDLVSSGRVEDLEVCIVDPETRRRVPDGTVGEIWVRGDSVAAGYWRNREATVEVFNAVTADGERGWLRSGDLGVLDGGQLFVTGRLKELLIVNGRNLYPADIEAEVRRAHPAIAGRAGAAFSFDTGREHVVVVQEVRAPDCTEPDLEQVAAAIRQRIAQKFGVRAPSVLLVRPGGVRRTTSGKIQRGLMHKLFTEQQIEALHERLDPDVAAHFRIADDENAA